jgi:hypothetical protein
MIVPGVRVRFGPFHVSKNGGVSRARFFVTILARSPATYADGRFIGASQEFREIGRGGLSTLETDDGGEDFYVIATLPSVFNAIKINAFINGLTRTATYPPGCADLKPAAGTPDLDNECLQGAVNPTGVVVPNVLPVAVIYEPPGNCSFATLTQEHTAGTTLTVQTANTDVTRSLNDPGLLASAFGSQLTDLTERKLSQNTRRSALTVSRSVTFSTPLGPSGNPLCGDPNGTVSPRDHSGPGEGDTFLLLVNPAFVYWNSFGSSNFVLAPPGKLKGLPPQQLVPVTASTLATPEGRRALRDQTNGALDLTEEQARAILKLDGLALVCPPNVAASSCQRRIPVRYLDLEEPIVSLAARQTSTGDVSFTQVFDANNQACDDIASTTSESEDPELSVRIIGTALQFDIGASFGASDDKVLSKLGEKILGTSLSSIFGGVKTTATTTYSTCRSLASTAADSQVQHYFVRDTNSNIAFKVLYDSFFSTVAFEPVSAGNGNVLSAAVRQLHLPSLDWEMKSISAEERQGREVPADILASLKNLGVTRLELAPSSDYVVPFGFDKGLPIGMRIEDRTLGLSGRTSARRSHASVALLYGLDARGARVAQIWLWAGAGQ